MKYWVNKRVWSERANNVPGQQGWVWIPLNFQIINFPKSRMAFKALVRRICGQYGPGRYLILRSQFEGEKPMFRPVISFLVRYDGKFRVLKRYTQYSACPEKPDAFFKQHGRRILVTVDIKERMRARRRALLERMKHEVKRPKPPKHTIRTGTGLWKYEARS